VARRPDRFGITNVHPPEYVDLARHLI